MWSQRILVVLGLIALMLLPSVSAGADENGDLTAMVEPNGRWHLRYADGSEITFFYGVRGDVPLLGDWDGDGVDTPGMFRPANGFVYLTNELPPNGGVGVGDPALTYFFGIKGDQVVVGDWNGDGVDTLGIRRKGRMFLTNLHQTGIAEIEYFFGVPGDIAFGGDANGDGVDTVFLYRASSGFVYYSDLIPPNGQIAPTVGTLFFGIPTDKFFLGDWDANAEDTVGVFRPSNTTVYQRNSNTTGPADVDFVFGSSSWTPVAGDFAVRNATLSGSAHDAGETGVNTTFRTTLDVGFDGAASDLDLYLRELEIVGPDAAEFAPGLPADRELGFGEARAIDIDFSPTSVGFKAATLLVHHTGQDSPLEIPLSAVGAYYINAGGPAVEKWESDSPSKYANGFEFEAAGTVSGPEAPNEVYGHYRFGEHSWDLPLPAGQYEVSLFFAESFHTAANQRKFDVLIEGDEVLSSFDILATAGGANRGIVRKFEVASDANMDLDFRIVLDSPAVQGIRVRPLPQPNELGAVPAEVDFGSIALGGVVTRSVKLVNLGVGGDPTITLESQALSGPGASQFRITSSSIGGSTLAPAQSRQVTLEYEPTSASVAAATLTIEHSGANSPVTITLSGVADDTIVYRLNVGGNQVAGAVPWIPDEPFVTTPPALYGEFTSGTNIDVSSPSLPLGTPQAVLRSSRFGSNTGSLSWALPLASGNYEVRLYFAELFQDAAGERLFDVNVEGGAAEVSGLDIFAAAGGKFDGLMAPIVVNVADGTLNLDLLPQSNLPSVNGIEVIRLTTTVPTLVSDPAAVVLGEVIGSGTDSEVVTFTNTAGSGEPSVSITSAVLGDLSEFGIAPNLAGVVLAPGNAVSATITFDPVGTNDEFTELEVDYGGATLLNVPITGLVDAPPVLSQASYSFGPIPRSSAVGTLVGTVSATDAEGDPFTYSIAGSGAGSFTIASNGQIRTTARPLPAATQFFTVFATGSGGTDSAGVSVSTSNVAPVIDNPTSVFSVDENVALGTVVGTVSAFDPDPSDTETFVELAGFSGLTAFSVNSANGVITTTAALDHEAVGSYQYAVRVSDLVGATGERTFTINVLDVNEAPGASPGSETVDEGEAVLVDLVATDPDSDNLTFSIVSGPTNGTLGPIAKGVNEPGPPDLAVVNYVHDGSETTSDSFTFRVEDPDGLTSATVAISITINPVNDPPVITNAGAAFAVDEDLPAGASVSPAVLATDPDVGDSLTFSETGVGTGAGVFAISSGGVITTTAVLDFETTPSYTYQVTVTDLDGLSDTETITVSVNEVNEAPTITNAGAARSVDEDAGPGTAVPPTVLATDPDTGDTLTFSETGGGTGAGVFAISPAGAITTTAALDFETTASYTYTVQVSDGLLTDTETLTINVNDVNEAPTAFAGSEVVDEGEAVLADLVASDPDSDNLTFEIVSGPTNGTLGPIAKGANEPGPLDLAVVNYVHDGSETTSDSFTFKVTDPEGLMSATVTISITINPVNEPPTITNAGAARSVDENLAAGASVPPAVLATDPDTGDALTFSETGGGTGAGVFQISTGGAITTSAVLDFETTASYTYTVRVTDSGGLTDIETLTITVNPVNEAPTITNAGAARSVNENLAAGASVIPAVLATDPDAGASLTFSETGGGTGAGVFAISSGGAITTTAVLNHEAVDSYTYTVQVSDGSLTDVETLTITVNDLNEAPSITNAGSAFSVNEGPAGNAVSPLVLATDPDAGASLTFSETGGGTGAGVFQISSGGAITSSAPLDVDATPSYTYEVRVSDGSLTDTELITITVNNVNEAPTITNAGAARSVDENLGGGTAVPPVVAATDPDTGDILTFSETGGGTGAGVFQISSGGAITTSTPLNHEAAASYTYTVRVTDSGGLTDTETLTISVNDVNEAPSITNAGAARSVNEGETSGTPVNPPVLATDPDAGASLTFSETGGGTGAGVFAIDSGGAITTTAVLDVDVAPSYTYEVQVSDGSLTDTEMLTITVNDVNEAPSITNAGAAFSVNEGTAGQSVSPNVLASDPDTGDTLTFSETGGGTGAAVFSISLGGAITSTSALDFETGPSSYTYGVRVSDGSLTDTALITITVNNVNEAPTITNAGAARSVDENQGGGTAVPPAVAATDPDAGTTLTFSETGGGTGAGVFAISSGGAITTTAPLNHESVDSYTYEVQVSDGSLTDTALITITVNDINEAPSITNGGAAFTIAEGAAGGSVSPSVAASDPDAGETLTFSETGNGTGAALFSISAGGAITSTSALDFEIPPNSYTYEVQVSDGALTDTATITITVTNINDNAPVVTPAGPFSVSEAATAGTVIGDVDATDADGDPITGFAIATGNGLGYFAINSAGTITLTGTGQGAISNGQSYPLGITATDGTFTSAPETVTVNVIV